MTSTGRDGKFDQIDLITKELEGLCTPMGKVRVNPHSRLVIVRDTKEAVDRMSMVLTRENAISTRQVSVRVRTLQIALNNGTQAGLSADVVFNAISDGLAKYSITFASPTSLATAAGSVGLSVLQPNAPFRGTNAVINGLNTFGKTIDDNTQTKMTLNGLPVSVGSFETKGYLASTTPGTGSLTGCSAGRLAYTGIRDRGRLRQYSAVGERPQPDRPVVLERQFETQRTVHDDWNRFRATSSQRSSCRISWVARTIRPSLCLMDRPSLCTAP